LLNPAKLSRYRALITLDPADPLAMQAPAEFASGTRSLMIHAWHLGQPVVGRYFPAMITWDGETLLRPGEEKIVTITIADEAAPDFLDAGQEFTLWGGGAGHGVISRRAYVGSSPS
jgi:hypothetical protein